MIIKQPTDPIEVKALKVLIYGQPGVRKTSWSFTAKNPLLLDFDGGVRRVNAKYRRAYGPINNWNDAQSLFDPKKTDLTPYDTIIIDTAGKALDMLAIQIMKDDFKMKRKDGALTQQGFGAMAIKFKDFLNRLTDLGKTVVLVAHDKEAKSGDETVIRPDITGQSMSNIMREVDLCGYMRAYNNKCTITFNPSDNFYGKNTCGLPEYLDITEKTLADVVEEALSNMNDDTELYQKYLSQINHIEKVLSICETADDLNQAVGKMREIEFVSDGKVQAANMVKTKATELGLTINKRTKLYEDAKAKVQGEPASA